MVVDYSTARAQFIGGPILFYSAWRHLLDTELELHPIGICDDGRAWHGRFVSLDDETPAGPFDFCDVAEIIAHGTSSNFATDWDGKTAAVIRLYDGRFVGWETFWGSTGDGFNEDYNGGDADVMFASDLITVVRMGLTDEGRQLCGWPITA